MYQVFYKKILLSCLIFSIVCERDYFYLYILTLKMRNLRFTVTILISIILGSGTRIGVTFLIPSSEEGIASSYIGK